MYLLLKVMFVFLPSAYVNLTDFDFLVYALWISFCQKLLGFAMFLPWAYPMKVNPETCRVH